MKNTLIILEKNPHSVIEKLLQDDPRLISRHTTRQYKADLFDFEAWRNGRPITKTLVEEYAAHLQADGKAPNTINQRLAAIRWYARKIADLAADYAGDPDLADFYAKQAARVVTVRDVKGSRPEKGRHIDQGELFALMRACTSDPSPAGIRDAAIIALAWSTGLRRDEISGLQLSDLINRTDETMDISIMGKGGKARVAYVNDGAFFTLLDWLELRGNDPGALFVNVNKGGRIAGGRLSGEALRKMLEKRSDQAELSQPVTWHDFRRTFAGNLWDAKIDGVTIQKLMGHASQNQTAKYDRRPDVARRQAVKVLHVPYKRK
jgi:integrase/recombinase XerC